VRTGIHGRRCAHQPPVGCRARRFIIFGLLAGALFTGIVATLGAHFVWENGAHYAFLSFTGAAGRRHVRRPDHPRPRVADLDRL
jgi:C4-dicarboxylate transporter DctQ subunit